MYEILENFAKKLPKFPDGRIDYRNSKEAAVLSIFVMFQGELLLLKRSGRVGNYRGRWNVVAGYFDEIKSVGEKSLEELEEETGIKPSQISKLKAFPYFKLVDKEIDKIFYVFPVLILLNEKPDVKLDWEHTEYQWIDPIEMNKFNVVYGLQDVLDSFK
ncbi:MAG: NUDIX domain-containing protein [Patescibacteria group bacterium]|nr:NUDIX domain-containing protein [Patescibacteria group bacterium]